VEVLSEPYALNLFREDVHNTWLMNGCATSRCHGGLQGGRLFLHRENHRDERVRSTNLLILERLRLEGQPPLVNYEEPMMSLLVQHALPRNRARLPHPDVPGWRPVFTPIAQPLLERTIAWIEAMMQPRPEYPIDYDPPALDPAPPPGERAGERVPR
jgi:hypothetical protein